MANQTDGQGFGSWYGSLLLTRSESDTDYSGHMVPYDQGPNALAMLTTWLEEESFE